MGKPPGKSLSEFMDDQNTLIADGIKITTMAIFSPVVKEEDAMWLAHCLNIHVMGTKWDYYKFVAIPNIDLQFKDHHEVAVLDTRKPEDSQVAGFAYPMDQQPVFRKYLGELEISPQSDISEGEPDERSD